MILNNNKPAPNDSGTTGGLSALLSSNSQAQQYFATLPAYVKETMMLSNQSIQSVQELRSCAENMVKGKQA